MSDGIGYTRTRIAPTPSGYLHLGNVLSFAITAWIAEQTGAKILLRIDDMDRQRTNKLYVQDIFDTLNFLEIPWHEGPRNMEVYEREYSQVHRIGLYEKSLEQLRKQGSVFACSCARSAMQADGIYAGSCRNKEIPYDAPETCWRIYADEERQMVVKTYGGTTVHARLPGNMRDFIVKKKDGYPAYQLTSLIDDTYFGVDLVVRGADLWPSTLAQLYLANVLGIESFGKTTFCHHKLLMADGGEKLSKSAGATSVQYLRKQGKTSAYIYSHIANLCGVTGPANDFRELVEVIGTNLLFDK